MVNKEIFIDKEYITLQNISNVATNKNTTSPAKANGPKPEALETNWQPIQEPKQNTAAIQNTQKLISDNRSQSQATSKTANFPPPVPTQSLLSVSKFARCSLIRPPTPFKLSPNLTNTGRGAH